MHEPVMLEEVQQYLDLKPAQTVLDCTVGCGGHARRLLEKIAPDGTLIGIDWDKRALEEAEKNLAEFKGRFKLVCDNFANLAEILSTLGIKKIDACLLDLGVSSLQLENQERGFSIRYDGPLDMRMDSRTEINASDVVNKLPEYELAGILREFGDERFSRSIAKAIVRERQKEPISSTWKLARIATNSIPARFRKRRIHPATRTFLALRIAVNKELENLNRLLVLLPGYLAKKARVCIISFHSLEDRIAKQFFKKVASENIFRIITKKPITPTPEEIYHNPRARSAKFRVAEKI